VPDSPASPDEPLPSASKFVDVDPLVALSPDRSEFLTEGCGDDGLVVGQFGLRLNETVV